MSLKPIKKQPDKLPNFIDELYNDDPFLGATPEFEPGTDGEAILKGIDSTDKNQAKAKRENSTSSKNLKLSEKKDKAS